MRLSRRACICVGCFAGFSVYADSIADEGCSAIDSGLSASFLSVKSKEVLSLGSSDKDQFCRRTVAKACETVAIQNLPSTVFYRETGVPNFWAMKNANALFLEEGMANDLFQAKSPTGWPVCLMVVLMHEVGHIFQYQNGYYDILRARGHSKAVEGHADIMAGVTFWILARKQSQLADAWNLALDTMFAIAPDSSNFASALYNSSVKKRKQYFNFGANSANNYINSQGNISSLADVETIANDAAEWIFTQLNV